MYSKLQSFSSTVSISVPLSLKSFAGGLIHSASDCWSYQLWKSELCISGRSSGMLALLQLSQAGLSAYE